MCGLHINWKSCYKIDKETHGTSVYFAYKKQGKSKEKVESRNLNSSKHWYKQI